MGNFFGLHLDFHLFSNPKGLFLISASKKKIRFRPEKKSEMMMVGLATSQSLPKKIKAIDLLLDFGWHWDGGPLGFPPCQVEGSGVHRLTDQTWGEGFFSNFTGVTWGNTWKHERKENIGSLREFTGYAWRVHKGSKEIHHFCWCIFFEKPTILSI